MTESVVRQLDNGLRVVVTPLPHLRSATVSVAVGVGSRYESAADNGLSHFLEHMLYRGTPRFPSSFALSRAVESLGGDLDAATAADLTTFTVSLPPTAVPGLLDILVELFSEPLFERLDVEKRIVREELLETLDEDGRSVDPDDLSRALLYGDHPLGLNILGSEATLARFTEADLRRHLERHYVAANTVLAVAGPVDPDVVLRAAAETLGRLRAGSVVAASAPPPIAPGPRTLHVEDSGSQTTVRVSFPTFGERDPRSPALSLLSRILDDGMSARLHHELIDERGLAYDVWAGLDLNVDCGVLDVSGTCAHERAPALLDATLSVLASLSSGHIDDEELEHARRRHLWALEASVDHCESVAEHAALATLLGLPRELDDLLDLVRRVRPEDVAEAARAVLSPGGLHVVTVGALRARQRSEVDEIARRWHPNGC